MEKTICDFCMKLEAGVSISDDDGIAYLICEWCDWTIAWKDEAFERAKAHRLVMEQ